MTKKVQNSAQSGTVQDVKVEVTKTTDDDLFAGIPFLRSPDETVTRPRAITNTDKSIIIVGGQKYEAESLTLEEAGKVDVIVKATSDYWGRQQENMVALDQFSHIKIGPVDFYVSKGCEINITDRLQASYHYESNKVQPSKVVLVRSKIDTKSLSTNDDILIIDSELVSDSSIIINKSEIRETRLDVSEFISVDDSKLRNVKSYNTKIFEVCESDLNKTDINIRRGIIDLRNVTCNNAEKFEISYWGCNDGTRVSIHGTYLFGFKAYGYATLAQAEGKPYRDISIRRRIDYGTFSGKNDIPFIRFGDDAIIVGEEVFTAEEFFPEYYKQDNKTEDGYRPWRHRELECSGTSKMRNGALWNKAKNVIFKKHYNGASVPGKLGEILIETLLKQIESRISLYIELHSLDGQ